MGQGTPIAESARQPAESGAETLAGLRAERDRLVSIIERLPDGFMAIDRAWRCTYMNAAAERLSGRRREDVLGVDLRTLRRDGAGDRFYAAYERAMDEQVASSFEGYYAPRGRWLGVDVVPVPEGVHVTFRDVTARKEAEKALRDSERIYRAIGESIDFGVWVCAPDGRNTYASESFLRLVGLTQQQCSDFGWGEVLHPDDAERTIAAWRECVRTGGTWDIEHRFRGVDGRWHPVLARGVAVRDDDGGILCWAGINLDIGRLKGAEEALRQADRHKDEFLAILSHELRNPLAAMHSAQDLLALAEPGSAQAARASGVLERQLQHLNRLVDDLLDVSRISSGKLRLLVAPADLGAIARRAVEDLRPLFHRLGLSLELREPGPGCTVEGDAVRLGQVFGNLLFNASKFTDPGGHVLVSVEREGDQVCGRVRDDGAGIAPEMLGRLFRPFAQAERTLERSSGGLGLGLALVKGIVELHGGTAEARSAGPGAGAEFLFRLPASPERSAAAPAPGSQGRGSRRRVLLIEDNEDAGETLRELLELQGHEVHLERHGRAGLEAARRLRPDVVVCDLGLPGIDGYEVARRLRADAALPRVTLVALTGYASHGDVAEARAAGFDHHLAKPPELAALERLLAASPVARP
ncbi:MAG: PAS domain-containing protein [Deltaproteobacteria bacterium]|nr:PAS domain-containing protein [Deltaproteobacteria bacterium]